MNTIRPHGKSRMNETFRRIMAEKGLKPCPLCSIQGKWDIYHTKEKPCDKGQPVQPDGDL